MAKFEQHFTLKDIFNNKNLQKKLPLINYTEKETEDGRYHYRTHLKTVSARVYETSKRSARPFYSPFQPSKLENTIILTGELIGDHDEAVDAVYNALMQERVMYIWTANNAYMVRDALKESEKNKRTYGIDTKLFLRAKSMQEIEGMTRPEIQALLKDIMDNIMYSDNFPKTQKKWQVDQTIVNSRYTYEQRKLKWKITVGD